MATRLDSKWVWHHAVEMRTTVTLDEDVERLLREPTHRSRSSFKETLNQAIRTGLGRSPGKASRAPFIVNAKPLGLRSGLDPADLNKLADDLEVDALRQNNRRAATA
ncbi:MAG: antitoxin [Verrucomicrobiota bacterium]